VFWLELVWETFVRSWLIRFTNSGLKELCGRSLSVWSCFSSSTGRTRVWQSLSLKKCLISLLILFLFSVWSEVPLYSFSEFSKYYLDEMGFPSLSINYMRNLWGPRKEGKYSANSSASENVPYVLEFESGFLTWSYFDKFTTKDNYSKHSRQYYPHCYKWGGNIEAWQGGRFLCHDYHLHRMLQVPQCRW
jgi:hypothetical protein